MQRTISNLKQQLSDLQASKAQDREENESSKEVKRLQSILEKVFSDTETDVVSVHTIKAIYELHKAKNNSLENLQAIQEDDSSQSPAANTEVSLIDKHLSQSFKKLGETFFCSKCSQHYNLKHRLLFNPCSHGSCKRCASDLTSCHICNTTIQTKENQFR